MKLAAVTLGHFLLLESFGSPLVIGGEALPGDVALGLYVLERPWKRAAEALNRRGKPWRLRLLIWLFREPAAALPAEMAMRGALVAALDAPKTLSSVKDSKALRAPWQVTLHARLMADFKLGYEAALDMPLLSAGWLSAAQAEREGVCEWIDPELAEYVKAQALGARPDAGRATGPQTGGPRRG